MLTGLPRTRQPRAIVIGLDDGTNGIQTARILSQRGIPVLAIANDPGHPCCRTRVCERILYGRTDTEECIATLKQLGPQLDQKAVLFPCQDSNVRLLSQHRASLEEWYHIVLPTHQTLCMLMDKVGFYTYAQANGLPIPATRILKDRGDAELAGRDLQFPLVLKPSQRSPAWMQRTRHKAFKVADSQELLSLYDTYWAWAEVLIAQEWIAGPDTNHYSCNCYFDADAEPQVTFVSRKLRQWPPQTGQGCLGEACHNSHVLHETLHVFQSVNYRGLAYLEMKQDARTGQYLIVEPNIGRPTGRSATAEANGVELLYTMYCDAVGWPLPENREQTSDGVKWAYARQDVQAALHQWWHGELSLKEWWQSWRGKKVYALFSWSDPLPFVFDMLRVIRQVLSSHTARWQRESIPVYDHLPEEGIRTV